jgi:hypothetical protein
LKRGRNDVEVLELLLENQDELQTLNLPILDQLATPSIAIKGRYDAAQGTCILRMETSGSGTEIFYTVDGSEPTMQSSRYDTELSFSQPIGVAARAYRKGIASETVASIAFRPSLSTGKTIRLAHQYSARYAAGGPDALVDGLLGSRNYKDGLWQGYEGADVEAVIDLGQVRQISRLSSNYLQDTRMWIFAPRSVDYSVSNDGNNFVPVGSVEQTVAAKDEEPSIKAFSHTLTDVNARFVKVLARSIGVCPPWHPGAGGKAWTFVDEITIE